MMEIILCLFKYCNFRQIRKPTIEYMTRFQDTNDMDQLEGKYYYYIIKCLPGKTFKHYLETSKTLGLLTFWEFFL